MGLAWPCRLCDSCEMGAFRQFTLMEKEKDGPDVLFVVATSMEGKWLEKQLELLHDENKMWKNKPANCRLLVTGIGMVNTAIALSTYLVGKKPRLVVNLGIAGAYPGGPAIGEVVEISEDCFGELGAESPDGFLGLETMGFPNFEAGGKTYFNRLPNPKPGNSPLRKCKGLTVNKVHGLSSSIAESVALWAPEVETMESAAVFQACLMAGVPFQCYRGISNQVEPRNRENWRIKEAVEAVQTFVFRHFLAPNP